MANKIAIVALIIALPCFYLLGKKVQKGQQNYTRESLLELHHHVKAIEKSMYPFAVQMYEKGLNKGIEIATSPSTLPLKDRVDMQISQFTKYVNEVQKDTTNQFFYVK